jgi:hypothetical protein
MPCEHNGRGNRKAMAQTESKNKNHSSHRLTGRTMASLSPRVRRTLDKLEQNYKRHPSVEALKKYVEEIESFCEAEIETGRVADTPRFWATIYLKVLVSVKAKSNFLIATHALHLGRTGGGRPGEQATFEETQRELSRFVAEIERKLADAEGTERVRAIDPAGENLTDEREFVRLLLRDRGLSINDWAVQSGVDFHTADRYLKGVSNPYPSTREKLAKSLGMTVEDLPH